MKEAIKWLHENLGERPMIVVRTCGIENEQSVQQAQQREKLRQKNRAKKRGAPPLLTLEEYQAVLQYSADIVMNIGIDAIKAMICNAINYLYQQKGKEEISKAQFTKWLRDTPELHIIKSKLITQNYIEIYLLEDLEKQFTTKYILVLKETGINKLSQEEQAS